MNNDWNPEDPRTKKAAEALKRIVFRILGPKPGLPMRRQINRQMIDTLYEAIREHKKLVKLRFGIDFPVMTILYLPSVDEVRLHPRELPLANIGRIALNLKIEFGGDLPFEELSQAVHAAWPEFKPEGSVLDKAGTSH